VFSGLNTFLFNYSLTVEVYGTDFDDSSAYVHGVFAGSKTLTSFCNPGSDSTFTTCIDGVDVTGDIMSSSGSLDVTGMSSRGQLDVSAFATDAVDANPYLGYLFYVRYVLQSTSTTTNTQRNSDGNVTDNNIVPMIIVISCVIFLLCCFALVVTFCCRAKKQNDEHEFSSISVNVPEPSAPPLPSLPPTSACFVDVSGFVAQQEEADLCGGMGVNEDCRVINKERAYQEAYLCGSDDAEHVSPTLNSEGIYEVVAAQHEEANLCGGEDVEQNIPTNSTEGVYKVVTQHDDANLRGGGDVEHDTATYTNERFDDRDYVSCCICLDDEASYAMIPCGHLCLCGECSTNITLDECPICRESVTSTMKIYTV
jgi:hypothetical protein